MTASRSVEARRAALSDRRRALLTERLDRARRRTSSTQRISPRPDRGPARLSFAQQRLWFLDQLVPNNPFYNIPSALELPSRINVAAFERAIREIVRRHEVLRTRFELIDRAPVQRVVDADVADVELVVTDLRALADDERNRAVEELALAAATTPFDLSSDPLIRAQLLRLADDRHLALFTLHHIVADGWSLGVLFRELRVLYEAFASGRGSPLPELEIQYADFAEWQRTWLSGPVLTDLIDFWRRQLDELPALELPVDRRRPDMATFQGDNLVVRVEPELTARMRDLARTEGVTPFMALLTAFLITLQHATSGNDLVVGAPIAGRNRPEVEPLIGFFVNSLVLRFDLSGGPTGRELIARVKEVTLDAYAHQDLPFEQLVEELQPDRDLSRNPLTQVTFQLQNTPTATGELPDEADIALDVRPGTSIFDLAFSLWETKRSFVGMMQFSTDLFDEAEIADLFARFERAMSELLDGLDRPIDTFCLVAPSEIDDLVGARPVGPGERDIEPADLCPVHELVRRRAADSPDDVVITGGSADDIRAAELQAAANLLARNLVDRGIGRGDVVALEMCRGPSLVTGMLGVLGAGAAYLPIDMGQPAVRRDATIREAGAAMILTSADVDLTGGPDSGPPSVDCRLDDIAYVIATSGSTGAPKAVAVSHLSLANHMRWMERRFPLQRGDRVLQRTPPHFDASVWEFYAPLVERGTMVVEADMHDGDVEALADVLSLYRINVVQVVPTLLAMLADGQALAQARDLRRVFCGGETLTPQLATRFFELSAAELVNLYGPTETTIDATYWVCSPEDEGDRVPIGHPIANMQTFVLDRHERPVPPGYPGELYISGVGVSEGYIGRADLTAERYVMPSVLGGRRAFRTGDRVRRRRDGALEFLGRFDDQVKVRGHRIEPAEIERCLETHPAVRRAVVVARGQDQERELVGYVLQDDAACSADDVVRHDPTGAAERSPTVDDIEHVGSWQSVYDQIYRPGTERSDPAFDITGWTSSYDGAPIPAVEMASWLEETVDRILATRPRRVLEIGAGTGLIASRVAPRVEQYVATDFSEAAIVRLRAALEHVTTPATIARLAAHELDSLPDGTFDVVVLNSVVQYFPSGDYLIGVLDDALGRVEPGGSLFVGDVRNLESLSAFHLSVLRANGVNEDDDRLPELLESQLREERELVIDQRWFEAFAAERRIVSSVVARPKLSPYHNELTRFRYDVTMRVASGARAGANGDGGNHGDGALDGERSANGDGASDVGSTSHTDSTDSVSVVFGPDLADVGRLTDWIARHDDEVAVLEIPDPRCADDVLSASRLRNAPIDEPTCSGLDPAELVSGIEALGRVVDVRLSRRRPGAFDVVVAPVSGLGPATDPPRRMTTRDRRRTLRRSITHPTQQAFLRRVVPSLREHVAGHLPDYMVPAHLIVLDRLPTKRNGKIDHRRLPEPSRDRPGLDDRYVAPASSLERVVADVFADVLQLRRVGAHDHFFAQLGGHSLLATQVVSQLRDILRVELPLRVLFEAPTVAELSAALRADPANSGRIDRVADIVAEVSALSDHEARARLQATADEGGST